MPIDTLRNEWYGVRLDQEFYDWLVAEYQTPSFTTQHYDANMPWQGTFVDDPKLGRIGTKSNKTGNYLWCEVSLPKFLHGDNCRVLSLSEAREGIAEHVRAVEAKFEPFLKWPGWFEAPGVPVECSLTCKRVDFCYDRPIKSAPQVWEQIARSIGNPKRVTPHLSGVSYNKSKWEHIRFYDKGIESGNESYQDMVRYECELRGPKAPWYVDPRKATIQADGAREYMNRLFEQWPHGSSEVAVYGFRELLREHGQAGAAAIGLVLMPQLETLYKEELAKNTFYKDRNLALELRRRVLNIDLRVPEDAWTQSVVL